MLVYVNVRVNGYDECREIEKWREREKTLSRYCWQKTLTSKMTVALRLIRAVYKGG
jgi:hypothetical protein